MQQELANSLKLILRSKRENHSELKECVRSRRSLARFSRLALTNAALRFNVIKSLGSAKYKACEVKLWNQRAISGKKICPGVTDLFHLICRCIVLN